MLDKNQRRPLLDPFLLALKSRRVLVALCALISALIISLIPALEPMRPELLTVLTTLALAIIGGYSVEDAVSVARQTPTSTQLTEQIKQIVNALLDELNSPGAD